MKPHTSRSDTADAAADAVEAGRDTNRSGKPRLLIVEGVRLSAAGRYCASRTLAGQDARRVMTN